MSGSCHRLQRLAGSVRYGRPNRCRSLWNCSGVGNNQIPPQRLFPVGCKIYLRHFSAGNDGSWPAFESLSDLHPSSKALLQESKLDRMTEIQAKTWVHALKGKDVLGRSRTGTGKTMAFLLPAFEKMVQSPPDPSKVGVLVLSPTRELALQTGKQAQELCNAHGKNHLSQSTLIGGRTTKQDLRQLRFSGKAPTVMVATPNRLLAHLEESYITDDMPFAALLDNLQILVMDEADVLLSGGFLETITEILTFLPPPEKRQTFLFSATLQEGQELASRATKPDYVFVDCMEEESKDDNNPIVSTSTTTTVPGKVDQSYVIVPPSRVFSAPLEVMVELLNNVQEQKTKMPPTLSERIDRCFRCGKTDHQFRDCPEPPGPNERKKRVRRSKRKKLDWTTLPFYPKPQEPEDHRFKAVAFFPTIKQVMLYEGLLWKHLGTQVYAIHSDMDQGERMRVSNYFEYAENAALLSTDASARGVDYSGVTHVLQFGMAFDRETYIHRLGRTARAGERGEGLLVLNSFETLFLEKSLDGLDLKPNECMQSLLDGRMTPDLSNDLARAALDVRYGKDKKLRLAIEEASQSMKSFYKARPAMIEGSKEQQDEILDEATSSFLKQAGIAYRPRNDVKMIKPWAPGDGFDVGRRKLSTKAST